MGKGSNMSKITRARENAAKRASEEGKGGGGKAGMDIRKDANVADKIAAAQVERDKTKKAREEKKQEKLKEAQAVNEKIQKTLQAPGSKVKKNDTSLLDGY